MKIEKLPSGSYRVRKMINGKSYSFTFDKRPTQKEIQAQIDKYKNRSNDTLTFYDASVSYIEARSNTLSPSTIKEYRGTLKRLNEAFNALAVDDITSIDVQKEINRLAKDKSPKTVRNYHGFIASVLASFRPDLILRTNLPQKENKAVYVPNANDIKALLEYAYNTQFEVALYLGCASLRRGEICALTPEDIEGHIIHVNKSMVLNERREWVIKQPKTPESVRDIFVPDAVLDAIDRNGLYSGHPNSITDWMTKTEKKLNIQHFSFHKLRHYFASMAHESGISDADIMRAGGWKTDHVMKGVYRHSLSTENNRATSAVFNSLF